MWVNVRIVNTFAILVIDKQIGLKLLSITIVCIRQARELNTHIFLETLINTPHFTGKVTHHIQIMEEKDLSP